MRRVAARYGRRLTLAEANEAARARGGQCLSRKYEGLRKPLVWQCGEGHVWTAPLHSLRHKDH
eukprot:12888544-Prorocentrum_lima.AAC.1